MEELKSLNKTGQILECSKIMIESQLQLLKQNNASSQAFEKQEKINKSVENFIANLGNIDNISNEQYISYLMELCSLFKNAHISVKNKVKEEYQFLSQHLLYLHGKVYAALNDKLLQVDKIGGKPAEDVCKEMSKYICYETDEWLDVQLNKMLNFGILYRFLGIDYSNIELKNGQKLTNSPSTEFSDYYEYFPPYYKRTQYEYSYAFPCENIIKINYRSCHEHSDGDFLAFTKEVEKEIENRGINAYILDIRGNTGGNSEIIWPLINLLKNRNMTGCVLTDNRVFSSGTFAAYYAKKTLNATLIGQPLAQENERFGQGSGEIVLSDTLSIRITEKYFKFSDVFKNSGAIKPDIVVPLTIEELQNKKDKNLETTIEYLQNLLQVQHQQEC